MNNGYICTLNVPTKCISNVNFHPTQDKIIVSSKTGGLLLYHIHKQSRPVSFQLKDFSPVKGQMTKDGEKLISASYEGKLGFWETHKTKPTALITGHHSRINDMSMWNNNGDFITASNDKSVKIWDSELKFKSSFTFHKNQVFSCVVSQNSTEIVSGDASGTTLFWDSRNPDENPIFLYQLSSTKRESIINLDISLNNNIISILSEKGHLTLLDIRNLNQPQNKLQFKCYPSMAKLHPIKPYILFSGLDNSIYCYDYNLKSLLFTFEGHQKFNSSLTWSNNGKEFISSDIDGNIIIWKLPKPQKMAKLSYNYQNILNINEEPFSNNYINEQILLEQCNILSNHINEFNKKLINQEYKIENLLNNYPSIGGNNFYEC